MNPSVSPIAASAPTLSSRTDVSREFVVLGGSYFATFLVASMTISACGPGCCFVFYSIFAGVSGLLMLRQSWASRCLCCVVLLGSLGGMWYEKAARETWHDIAMKHRIAELQAALTERPAK
jgi:hypothetical protein